MNCFRRVLTLWEKKAENYEAMLHFVCSIIIWNKTLMELFTVHFRYGAHR
jgi:hypothetical protein